jgi:hypothetical protein
MKKEAGFVTEKQQRFERFKYSFSHFFTSTKTVCINITKKSVSIVNQTLSLIPTINYKAVLTDLSFWLLETFIEGLTANFATHYLFHVKLTIPLIFAHGIIINQGISIIKRVAEIKHGSNKQVLTETTDDKQQ